MSRNESHPKLDRRIRRTRDRLGDALVELIQEQPFDSITVQQVLDRAGVSRSTFYVHFRDKQDLFLSDVDEFFDAMANALVRHHDASHRVAPVRELFAHVAEQREFFSALVRSGKVHDVLELGQAHFTRGIEQRLSTRAESAGSDPAQRAALANLLAGALMSLLTWWVAHGHPHSPDEMDALFHRFVDSGVPPSPAARTRVVSIEV
jgi:AcrR family transcriptional regulator